jgi:hypothetical protein
MDRELAQRIERALGKVLSACDELKGLMAEATEQLAPAPVKVKPKKSEVLLSTPMTGMAMPALPKIARRVEQPIVEGPYGEFTKAERRVLVALAQIGKPVPAVVVGLVARISHKTGPFGTTLAELRRSNYITGPVSNLSITAEGLAALGDFAEMPRGHDLFEYWCNKLPGSCGKIMRALRYTPEPIPSEHVGNLAGISSTTGPFGTALATLRKLDFITGTNRNLALSYEVKSMLEPTIGIHETSTGRSVRVRAGRVQ